MICVITPKYLTDIAYKYYPHTTRGTRPRSIYGNSAYVTRVNEYDRAKTATAVVYKTARGRVYARSSRTLNCERVL